MKFRTVFNHECDKFFESPTGSRFRCLYERTYDPVSKKKSIKKSGEEDTYRFIQECAKGNLVCDIIQRSIRGDSTAIGTVSEDMFADITQAPKSLLEAEQLLIKARSIYDSLPVDTKRASSNDFSVWLSSVNDGSFFKDNIKKFEDNKRFKELQRKSEVKSVLTDEQVNKIKEIIKNA